MALAFPAGPASGQQYTAPNGVIYEWDSAVGVWKIVNSVQTMTTGSSAGTGAARLPTGTTGQRPAANLAAGQFRYNTSIPQLEYSDGTSWIAIAITVATLAQAQAGTLSSVASSPETTVPKDASGMAGSAFIPTGTTAQRPAAGSYTGQLRYNTTIPQWEYSNGASWLALSVSAATLAEAATGTSSTVYLSPLTGVPKDASGMTGSAFIPSGTTAQQPAASLYTGQLRYNTTVPQWEYSNGASWLALVSGIPAAATLAEAAAGTLNTVYLSPETGIAKDASGVTGAALIPGGTTAQQPATPVTGMVRYNSDTSPAVMEWYNGTAWSTTWGVSSASGTGIGAVVLGTSGAPSLFGSITLGALVGGVTPVGIKQNEGMVNSSIWVSTTGLGGTWMCQGVAKITMNIYATIFVRVA